MQWYIDKLDELKKIKPDISTCGDDCAVCPRHVAKTLEELNAVAEFWFKVGWRDRIESPEEITCTGCPSVGECGYKRLCCEHGEQTRECGSCNKFPCGDLKRLLEVSYNIKDACKAKCKHSRSMQCLQGLFTKRKKI